MTLNKDTNLNFLFPIHTHKGSGYIDIKGKVILKPSFWRASKFSEGLAAVMIDDKVGYINHASQYIIKPKFDYAQDSNGAENFVEGLAAIAIEEKIDEDFSELKKGYINSIGNIIIQPQFTKAYSFSEGFAKVGIWENKLIDIQRYLYHNQNNINGYLRYAFVDREGKIIFEDPLLGDATDFKAGFAAVSIEGNWGYIDSKGQFWLEPQFANAKSFSGDLAAVRHQSGKWGYIDTTGKFLIEPQFADAQSFSEGLAAVQIDDGSNRWGYINNQGKLVISPQFIGYSGTCGDFHNELAWIRVENMNKFNLKEFFNKSSHSIFNMWENLPQAKYGYIDKTGKFSIPPSLAFANDFDNGLAWVYLGDFSTLNRENELGYIDKTGKLVWKSH